MNRTLHGIVVLVLSAMFLSPECGLASATGVSDSEHRLNEAILPLPTSELLSPKDREQSFGDTLELAEVLALVESHHPRIRSAALTRGVAAARVLERQGAFDPSLGLDSNYQRYNSTSRPGQALHQLGNTIAVTRTDPSGIRWEGGWNLQEGTVKSPLSATGTGGELFLEAKIPLLRGLGVNPSSTLLQQSQLLFEQTEFDLHRTRLNVLLEAGSAFFRWNATVMQWRILEENLQLAKDRAEQVRIRIEAGDLPTIDQIEADREVTIREDALLRAGREIQRSALTLAMYLWNSEGSSQAVPAPEQAPQLLPETSTVSPEQVTELQLKALVQRPELRRLKLDRSIIDLDRELAENDRLPQLDLTLRPGVDLGQQSIGPTIKAGVELVIPLGTRTFDGRRQAAVLKLDQIDLDKVQTLQAILIQVQDAASEVEATAQRLLQAREIYEQSLKLEEAERLRFELGDSTLFLVNIRERSTVEAALGVLALGHEHAQASLLLDAAVGRL